MTAQSCANLYLSDILSLNQLAFRFMLIQGLQFLATSLGNLGIGYLILYIEYSNSFWVILSLYATGFLYIIFFLPESLSKNDRKPFDAIRIMKQSVTVLKLYVRKGRDCVYINYKLCLLLGVVLLDNFIILGRNDVDVLYMLGSPFCWSSVTIGYFQAVKYLLKG